MNNSAQHVSFIIPCLNEAETITAVIKEAKSSLPEAQVVVIDNGSEDDTAKLAEISGATVLHCDRRGKGNALREAFARINSDIYIMIDGDATYDLSNIQKHITLFLSEQIDLLVGNRLVEAEKHERKGHYWGNQLFSKMMSKMFDQKIIDPFSGYRIMSRRFVQSFPSVSKGFEVETEMTVHAMDLAAKFKEVPITYRLRPENSESKLRTYSDGYKILSKLIGLYQLKKPFAFYGSIALVLAIISLILFSMPLSEFISTGEVPRFPTLIVSMAGFMSSFIMFLLGLVLHNQNRNTLEIKRFLFRTQSYRK